MTVPTREERSPLKINSEQAQLLRQGLNNTQVDSVARVVELNNLLKAGIEKAAVEARLKAYSENP